MHQPNIYLQLEEFINEVRNENTEKVEEADESGMI